MTYNLTLSSDRKLLSSRIKNDINEYCEQRYKEGHRNHLGASIMGDECLRQLWYTFRWVKEKVFDGRMQRLFQVGHKAEPRYIEYLLGIGFQVSEFTADGKQHRITGCDGHYGGSLDAMCKTPESYGLVEDLIFLNEFKTNGTGAGYADVSKLGVARAKAKHWAQMCQYGFHYKLHYGIYIIENKNDSDLTVEVVELDLEYGEKLQKKAKYTIESPTPPARINDNPSYHECKYCHFSPICHENAAVDVNCRSCRYAFPTDNATWYCALYKNKIPSDFIPKGCSSHQSINKP